MQNTEVPRAAGLTFLVSTALVAMALLAGCSKPAGEVDRQAVAPASAVAVPTGIVTSNVHTITVVSAQPLDAKLAQLGFTQIPLPANYPPSVRVEAGAWGVSELQANAATYWQGGTAGAPKLRVLVVDLPALSTAPAFSGDEKFMRDVLGFSGPIGNPLGEGEARLMGWSFLTTTSTIKVRDHLRAVSAPVSYGPVAISTPYLGDHEFIVTRTPSGRFVEIVKNSAE